MANEEQRSDPLPAGPLGGRQSQPSPASHDLGASTMSAATTTAGVQPGWWSRKLRGAGDVWRAFLDSPGWKTFVFIAANTVSGVCASSFIVEISDSHGLHWDRFHHSPSFYVLLVAAAAMFVVQRAIYSRETEIHNFMDADFCVAYMRSKCLPEAADRYRKMIREGNGGEMKQAMDELKKILNRDPAFAADPLNFST